MSSPSLKLNVGSLPILRSVLLLLLVGVLSVFTLCYQPLAHVSATNYTTFDADIVQIKADWGDEQLEAPYSSDYAYISSSSEDLDYITQDDDDYFAVKEDEGDWTHLVVKFDFSQGVSYLDTADVYFRVKWKGHFIYPNDGDWTEYTYEKDDNEELCTWLEDTTKWKSYYFDHHLWNNTEQLQSWETGGVVWEYTGGLSGEGRHYVYVDNDDADNMASKVFNENNITDMLYNNQYIYILIYCQDIVWVQQHTDYIRGKVEVYSEGPIEK